MVPSRPMEDPGGWPDVRALIRTELTAYVSDAADPSIQNRPTRCEPWTIADLTRHLAATVARFRSMVEQSRGGDLTPPFGRNGLSEENLRAVREFSGEPIASLRAEAERFLQETGDPEEIMAHQFGPITVGLQQHFLLNELAIHHDDLAAASGSSYRPPEPVVEVLSKVYTALRWWRGKKSPDPWARILFSSGR
jgi:uncharacterized protein (TIGR03083 family)